MFAVLKQSQPARQTGRQAREVSILLGRTVNYLDIFQKATKVAFSHWQSADGWYSSVRLVGVC